MDELTRKYRKKPVVIRAYQTARPRLIRTLEGDMAASVGDFIITGVNGEQYPCKPDIFAKTYELVEEPCEYGSYCTGPGCSSSAHKDGGA